MSLEDIVASRNESPENLIRGVAKLCEDVIGEGGFPDAPRVEEFLGYVNTPYISKDGNIYVRVLINEEFAYILELLQKYETYRDLVEIELEYHGQRPFSVTYEVALMDDEGVVTVESREDFLGYIQGIPILS